MSNLFNEVKKFVNSIPVGETFKSSQLIDKVGEYEVLTSWKKWNNNPNYRTHSYKTVLKRTKFISPVKRGEWRVNFHIPEWVNLGVLEFLTFGGAWDKTNKCKRKTYNGLTKDEILSKLQDNNNQNSARILKHNLKNDKVMKVKSIYVMITVDIPITIGDISLNVEAMIHDGKDWDVSEYQNVTLKGVKVEDKNKLFDFYKEMGINVRELIGNEIGKILTKDEIMRIFNQNVKL